MTRNSNGSCQASKVKDFLQTYCLLSRDEFAGKPIRLLPWQHDFIDRFFGTGRWQDEFFRRTYRHARIFTPKKSGKSSFLSGLAIWFALEKHGNEVLVVASTINQAKIIFNETAYMVKTHPMFRKLFWVRDHRNLIECRHNHSIIKVVSSNPSGISGWNGDVLADEICEWAPSTCHQVWSKLQNAGAARKNAAVISISHANYHLGEHVGYQEFLRSQAILDARAKGEPDPDPQCLPIIYSADLDRVDDPREWERVNPGWGVTIDPEEFAADYARAKANPRDWNRFLLFRLNCFVGSLQSYISPADYDRAECDFDEASLHGLPGIVWGLDLSRRRDLTAYIILIPKDGLLYLVPRIFTPADTIDTKSRQDKVDYRTWEKAGHIITSPHDTIDQAFLIEHVMADARNFWPTEVRYDPWGADLLAQALTARGLPMAEAPVNRTSFLVPPTAELERAFMAGKVRVPKNPCMKWNFSNAVVKNIGSDNIIVNKSACTARVDSCIASILAMSGYMATADRQYADLDSGMVV